MELRPFAAVAEEEVLLGAYPCEARAHEVQHRVQRNGGRSLDQQGAVRLHGEAQGAAAVALEGEAQAVFGQAQRFRRGGAAGRALRGRAALFRTKGSDGPWPGPAA